MTTNEGTARLECPRWFFGLGAILLFARPIASLTGFLPFLIPPDWEVLSLSLMVLFLAGSSRHQGFGFGLGVVVWILGCAVIPTWQPLSPALRWLLLLGVVELFSPAAVPQAWCLFWLVLPAFTTSLWGEPLAGPLSFVFAGGCLAAAYRATIPEWVEAAPAHPAAELLVGMAMGVLASSFAPVAPPLDETKLPTIVFDEEHGSTESALGARALPNGHQEMAWSLRRKGFPVILKEDDAVWDLASASIFVTVLPSSPYSRKETEALSAFVEGGGKFLAILDHTDMDGASSRLAPLLLGFGVVPAFDTIAWPTHRLPAAGLSRALGEVLGFPGTGGSLVRPSFWWPYPFSPAGPHPLSWIDGNAQAMQGVPSQPLNQQMSYPEEPYSSPGPIWTGAWGQFGKGRWVVLADSSWFQNGQVALNRGFMTALLSLLVNGTPTRSFLLWTISWSITLLGFWKIHRRLGKPLLPLGIILGLLLTEALTQTPGRDSPGPVHASLEVPTTFVPPGTRSGSSSPKTCFILDPGSPSTITSLRPGTFDSNLDTMGECLSRCGFELDFFQEGRNVFPDRDLYIFPPTDSPPSPRLLAQLRDQVSGGADLILLGSPDLPGSRATFEAFGFSLEMHAPNLFRYEMSGFGLPQRAQTPPVRLEPASHAVLGSWTEPLYSDLPNPVRGGEPLFLRDDGMSVISCQPRGEGWIIAVGDETFFQNRSLEIRGKLEDRQKKAFIEYLGSHLQNGVRDHE